VRQLSKPKFLNFEVSDSNL